MDIKESKKKLKIFLIKKFSWILDLFIRNSQRSSIQFSIFIIPRKMNEIFIPAFPILNGMTRFA